MEITAADIAKLRKLTGAGMMDCKVALNESGGDFNLAIEYLRKKGQKISAKRADREASEGVIIAKTNADNTKGVIVELNCETDFVAKNADFVKFANEIATEALNRNPQSLDELKNYEINKVKISDLLNDQVARIGEKIELNSFRFLNGNFVSSYIHLGNKIGVLVSFNKSNLTDLVEKGKDIAMQIAAMNPIAVDKDNVSQEIIQKEIEIAKEQVKNEGKPDAIAEKIALGKLNKFFQENTLLNQDFVKDSSKTVRQFLQEIDKELLPEGFIRVAITA
jgi:elongation factor Ts